jgi:DNA-directed RNA polymerase subunit RPC12/RpoP
MIVICSKCKEKLEVPEKEGGVSCPHCHAWTKIEAKSKTKPESKEENGIEF